MRIHELFITKRAAPSGSGGGAGRGAARLSRARPHIHHETRRSWRARAGYIVGSSLVDRRVSCIRSKVSEF